MSYGKIGLTTVAVIYGLLLGMPFVLKIELIRLWNSILPEPGQPSAQLSKFIRLTACKKDMHAIRRWYRTVHIPWLGATYDTHKGKRWLNSNPPNHRGKISRFNFSIYRSLHTATQSFIIYRSLHIASQSFIIYRSLHTASQSFIIYRPLHTASQSFIIYWSLHTASQYFIIYCSLHTHRNPSSFIGHCYS